MFSGSVDGASKANCKFLCCSTSHGILYFSWPLDFVSQVMIAITFSALCI